MQEYTWNQISSHCTAEDLWIVYDGKVYDMTPYFKNHPGGIAMLRQAGKDASIAILSTQAHSIAFSFIQKTLEKHLIGVLKK